MLRFPITVAATLVLAGCFALPDDRANQAKLQLTQIEQQAKEYTMLNGAAPKSLDDLTELDAGSRVDPWGNPFILVSATRTSVDVISYGADGKQGGTGANADLRSSEL